VVQNTFLTLDVSNALFALEKRFFTHAMNLFGGIVCMQKQSKPQNPQTIENKEN
jgi:hypothetical protein